MLAVTLLSVAAATLAILIARQVVVSARANVFEQLSSEARSLASDALDDVAAQLEADPTLALRQVLAAETPRRCVVADPADPDLLAANPDHPLYSAGQVWPAACGVWWEHEPVTVDPLAVRVLPPSSDADLEVHVLAVAGKVQAGMAAQLQTADAGAYAVWTDGNLSVDELADGPVSLSGRLYASDRILLPSAPVTFEEVQLAAEDGFVGTLDDSDGQRFYSTAPVSDTDPPVRNIRDIVAVEGSRASLRASIAAAAQVACPDAGDPAVVTLPDGPRSSQLCLEPGRKVRDSGGNLVQVPEAGAFLLLPDASAADRVDVYVRDEAVDTSLCQIRCDLYGLAARDVAAGDHPGVTAGWQLLGSFPVPTSGVIGSPAAQTHVGLCGAAFVGAAAACEVSEPQTPLTVVAGTAQAPQDVIVGGPVRGVGLLATGDVRLAFWAGPAGADVELGAHIVTPGTFNGLPTRRASAPVDSTAGRLTLTGSLAAGRLQPVRGFQTVAFTASALEPTPWLAGPDGGLELRPARRLSPLEACGARVCEPW